ncbi:putative P-loop containing nucleoside triphosphate hydrolase [Helianthus debilis subsp. tardiflorus]
MKKVVQYCKGHPLALKVLGSSFCSEDATWEDILESLGKEINPDIKKVLEISYDTLSSEKDKELFKYIACLFVGEDRKFTEDILKACGICKPSGIKVLVNRCLLTVGSSDELMMHQLLQEMGRDVVRQESPNKPWERSILLNHEECLDVLQNKQDLCSLGWINIAYLNHYRFLKSDYFGMYHLTGRILPSQMLYEHGIFSTYLQGQEVPKWFTHRSSGSLFTLQSSPETGKIKGLNVCIVHTISSMKEAGPSRIKISNLTKNSSWTYQPIMYLVPEDDAFEDGDEVVVVRLSHWMFGKNEFEDGDKVLINFSVKHWMLGLSYGGEGPEYANVREYGISPVYDDDGGGGGKQKEDALGYYKSWKHIIGGDLSAFEASSTHYVLKPYDVWFRP